MPSPIRTIAFKILAVLMSIVLSILFLEAGLRLIAEPIDLLKPYLAEDPELGWAIEPGSGGHDALGFRNPSVPERADIVALGDSMTYGFGVRMRESWPSQLERRTGQRIYNMGNGGYGPAEYAVLLETRVPQLEPDLIIVGLYFGNDLYNAYTSVRDRPRWADLHDAVGPRWPANEERESALFQEHERRRLTGPRGWLRGHSMLLRSLELSPIGENVNAVGDRGSGQTDKHCHVQLEAPFQTVLKLDDRIVGVDLGTTQAALGLDLTIVLIERIIAEAAASETDLAFVLIPSKERVLATMAGPLEPVCALMLDRFVENERTAYARIVETLQARGVRMVDPYEALVVAAARERIYPRSGDTHPNDVGYGVIADEIAAQLGM